MEYSHILLPTGRRAANKCVPGTGRGTPYSLVAGRKEAAFENIHKDIQKDKVKDTEKYREGDSPLPNSWGGRRLLLESYWAICSTYEIK